MFLSSRLYDVFLTFLDDTYLKKELPDNVKDVYDADEYSKFISYRDESKRLNLISNILPIIINLLLFIFNIHSWMFSLLSGMHEYLQYLVVICIFAVVNMILHTPFDYYDTFVIEEKYDLNTTTKTTFFMDMIKDIVINIVMSSIVLVLVACIFTSFGNMGIVWSTCVMMIFNVLLSIFAIPMMRLFNKFTPLGDGDLRSNLTELCNKYGFPVKDILVMDASRRTNTSNAFCTGLGKRKTISLDDNLINSFSTEEITAVFAHELAHAKYYHAMKSLPFTLLQTILLFVSFALVLNISGFYDAFGFTRVNYYFAWSILDYVIWPVSTLAAMGENYLSKKHEYQADAFAAINGYGAYLISALKRLDKEALSNINPHPFVVDLEYSHPTLSQRISAIEEMMDEIRSYGVNL